MITLDPETLDTTERPAPAPASDLGRRAMLVALHISAWTGAKLAREADATISAYHQSATDRTRTTKRLVDPTRLAALTRLRHHRKTGLDVLGRRGARLLIGTVMVV